MVANRTERRMRPARRVMSRLFVVSICIVNVSFKVKRLTVAIFPGLLGLSCKQGYGFSMGPKTEMMETYRFWNLHDEIT
jgi:hypothetical protein